MNASRGKLLLVEDDAALAELLAWHFSRENFDVRQTGDGEEALLLAQESPPDLVLLDWMIEGLSGLEVCRRLRRMSATQNVPIIMLTARGEEEDRVRGLETGADDYVTKPFSPRELVARVGAVLRRVRPALAGEQLTYADPARRCRSGRPNSGCSGISWSIRDGCFRASGCSTASGAMTPISSCGRSMCTSGGFARPSIRKAAPTSSAPSAARAMRWTPRASSDLP